MITTDPCLTHAWPKQFPGPGAAVRWADGFLLSEGKVRSTVTQASIYTSEDYRDQAQTISVALSGVRNPPGMVYRYLWGRQSDITEIADRITRSMWNTMTDRDGKQYAQLQVLTALVLQEQRRVRQGSRLTSGEMAHRMHYRSRRQFTRVWAIDRDAIRCTVRQWHDEAERDLWQRLSDIAMV